MMMVVMMMVVPVMVVVVMMVVVVVILRHYNRLFFADSGVALVLSAQNLLGIGNGIQQLGKRLGRL
jgi:hypothetical protein